MIIDHYGTLSRFLLEKAAAINFNIQGPAETEYGFGWEPTVSFWFEHRRVHFYFDFGGRMTVEVSEFKPDLKIKRGEVETDTLVKRATIKTTEEAWDIVECYVTATVSPDGSTSIGYEENHYGLSPEQFILGDYHNVF